MTNCNFLNGEVPYSRLRWIDSLTNLRAYLSHSHLGDATSHCVGRYIQYHDSRLYLAKVDSPIRAHS